MKIREKKASRSLANKRARHISTVERSLANKIISNNLLNARLEYAGLKIAVFVHLFYIELWDEIRMYLGNFRELKFDLYVNLVESSNEDTIDNNLETTMVLEAL